VNVELGREDPTPDGERSLDGVSVIICAYTLKRWEELQAAVDSVRAQTLPPVDVIVVIDGNQELFEIAEATFTDARVVMNNKGTGLSGGRTTGAESARGRLLAFLDDDAIATPAWLESFYNAYDDPQILGVGGLVSPLWRSAQPDWLPRELYWLIGCTYDGLPQSGRRIRNPIGANMSIRADVMTKTGPWALELGRQENASGTLGTADETEFAIRAVRTHPGGYWVLEPAAEVLHSVGPERTTWAYFVRRCRLEAHAKVLLTGLAGTSDGLASERTYAARVLPRAFVRELRLGLRGERAGFRRAGAIAACLFVTAGEYLRLKAIASLPRSV
jgi:hypothetical protein